MPFTHHISPSDRLAVVRFSGSVTGPLLNEALQRWVLDPDWRPQFRALVDMRLIRELIIIPRDLERFGSIVRVVRPLIGPGRTAIVAQRDLDSMSASLYAEHTMDLVPDREIRVFQRLHDALAWLEVKKDRIEAVLTADA